MFACVHWHVAISRNLIISPIVKVRDSEVRHRLLHAETEAAIFKNITAHTKCQQDGTSNLIRELLSKEAKHTIPSTSASIRILLNKFSVLIFLS